MSTEQRKVIRYSISFKRKVVQEIEEEGLGVVEASRRYGIKGGATVRGWLIKFGKHHLLNKIMRVETMEEKDRIKQLEEENKKLKMALADSMMEKRCLEVLIEEADKAYKTDLKKKLRRLCIPRLHEEYQVVRFCGFFGFSRQAYYKQLTRHYQDAQKDHLVIELVQEARVKNKMLGVRKLYSKWGSCIHSINRSLGRDKLFDLLRRHGLLVKRRRKYAVTTDSRHRFRKYENKIKGFRPVRPHQVWVGDITYLRVKQGFVYLFLLTDAYSRKIVGWELNKSLAIEGALQAARMAIKQCPCTKELIHHTDRGFQYCSPAYAGKMESYGIQMSMGEAGNCYDNAMAERINGILKGEYGLDATFENAAEALKATRESIEDYNEQRPHWSLQFQTPSVIHAA